MVNIAAARLTSMTEDTEARFVRHLTRITQIQPVRADAVQEFICFTAQAINAFLTIIGGTLPFTTYIEQKCDIPTPNNPGTDTTT